MPFAQTHYSQRLGTGSYSIADAGCFITSFANLLERLGEGIDPPGLNQYFISHDSYTHDPSEGAGTADNVGWSTIAAYDGTIVTTQVGGAGWPSSNDAIVKFVYTSTRTGHIVTHFCLVADHSNGTIIDSWDGVTKHSPYGTPVAWATYEKHAITPVPAPAPVEHPAFSIENIGEVVKELKIDTHIWDLNQRSWPGMVNNPAGTGTAGTQFKTSMIAHHVLGGSYYLPEGSTTQGYNEVDCEDPQPAPAPVVEAAAPVAPAEPAKPTHYTTNTVAGVEFTTLVPDMHKMYVIKQGGAEKWNFKGVTTWSGFKSIQHYNYGDAVFISGTAYHPLGARYEVMSNDWNGFDINGQPNGWVGFNKIDLSDKQPTIAVEPAPVVAAPVAPAPAAEVIPVTVTPPAPLPTTDWKSTYRAYDVPHKLIATRHLLVKELLGQKPDEGLPAYDPSKTPALGVVKSFGYVWKDGAQYERLKTRNDPNFDYWYCAPILDQSTGTANLLPFPEPQPSAIVSIIDKIDAILLPWFNKNKK